MSGEKARSKVKRNRKRGKGKRFVFGAYKESKHLASSEADEDLTIKQKMRILSRRDRLSPARPTWLRTLILAAVLFALMLVSNAMLTGKHRTELVKGDTKGENEVRLTFVGDVCFGRYVAQCGKRVGYASILNASRELWNESDAVFANLECVILDDEKNYTRNPSKQIWLPASREALIAARDSGITAVSLANNHAVDFGGEGIKSEIEALEELGIAYFGGGSNREEAASCRYFEYDGWKVALLGVCTIPTEGTYADDYTISSPLYTDIYRNIFEASLEANLVVVYAHWGNEYGQNLSDIQRSLAHRLIESGADIIIGSHPHILQNIEQYRDGLIFYSLGNYIFDQGTRENRNSVAVQMNIDKTTGEAELVLIPIRIDEFAPHVTGDKYYIRDIQNALTEQLSTSSYSVKENGRICIPFSVRPVKENPVQ